MKYRDVCHEFFLKRVAACSNISSTGDKLYSFNTCIAQWNGDYLLLNYINHSFYTRKHLDYLKIIAYYNMNRKHIIAVEENGFKSFKEKRK